MSETQQMGVFQQTSQSFTNGDGSKIAGSNSPIYGVFMPPGECWTVYKYNTDNTAHFSHFCRHTTLEFLSLLI
jgi:hypothetical protein